MKHLALARLSGGLAALFLALGCQAAPDDCIDPLSYWALDTATVGPGTDGQPALGSYERISPDGRFVLRSYSGGLLGKVSLIELPAQAGGPLRAHVTPLSNEAFPVQGSWRYLVDVQGEHYRFRDVLQHGRQARPLFKGGMTGFYAAASELSATWPNPAPTRLHIRSLSWPQSADSERQGVGPLQLATIEVKDDGDQARVVQHHGPQFICGQRVSVDGNAFALPMISIDGAEFSAIPQAPRQGQPSMRVYSLNPSPDGRGHPCEPLADLGSAPSKAVFGFAQGPAPAWLSYSDLGHIYVFDRDLQHSFRLDHGRHRVLASAFPGLTVDGRVVYAATWEDCRQGAPCRKESGYVVSDPYQSRSYRLYWQERGTPAPKACITRGEVAEQRRRFARFHGIDP